jgi:hypothetical protein
VAERAVGVGDRLLESSRVASPSKRWTRLERRWSGGGLRSSFGSLKMGLGLML